jgi:hypothetical protein
MLVINNILDWTTQRGLNENQRIIVATVCIVNTCYCRVYWFAE